MKNCPICDQKMIPSFSETILNKYKAQFFYCRHCNFVQTEKPYWLAEAYDDAIASSDTGLVQRNFVLASKLATYIFLNLNPRNFYLDVAGGYGMLTRLMRDFGFNYFWTDPYCKNLLAVGFDRSVNDENYAAISAFEVLEHVEDPVGFIATQMQECQCKTIIFSTELFSGAQPPSSDWWYYSLPNGQHISFFSAKSLAAIAKKLNLKFYSFNGLHVLTEKIPAHLFLTHIFTKSYIAPFCAFLIRFILGSKTVSDSQKNLLSKKNN